MNIGNRIQEARKHQNMTQEDLATKLNVSRSTIASWESGRNIPDVNSLIELSKVLKIPFSSLSKGKNGIARKRIMKIGICLFLVAIVCCSSYICYRKYQFSDIIDQNYIKEITVDKDILTIETDLPFYKSLAGASLSASIHNQNAIEIHLISKIDLSLSNNNAITYSIDELTSDFGLNELDEIYIMYQDKILKKYDL